MAGGDIDLTMGFNASAGERDSQNFWRKQERQIIGFQNVSKVAFLAFAAAGAAGFKAMSIAAEDGSSAAKQQLDSFHSEVRKMSADIGRELAETGVVGWFGSVARESNKARVAVADDIAAWMRMIERIPIAISSPRGAVQVAGEAVLLSQGVDVSKEGAAISDAIKIQKENDRINV